MKNTIITKIENIINNSADCYNYEIVAKDWIKGDMNRTYIAVIETADHTKHYKKHEFGYIDNITNEYIPGKWNADQRFTLGGTKF